MSKVVAKTVSVQNSAGTATTDITFDGTKLVNTALDNAIAAKANTYDLGVGQTWQDVTASRALGVTYTNTTGKPIIFAVTSGNNAFGHTQSTFVNGVDLGAHSTAIGVNLSFAVVPAGATYMTIVDGGATLMKWTELR